MKRTSPQQREILNLLDKGEWVCSNNFYMRDYRKRIVELIRMGYNIETMKCDGHCGIKHKGNVSMRRWTKIKPTTQVDLEYYKQTGIAREIKNEIVTPENVDKVLRLLNS